MTALGTQAKGRVGGGLRQCGSGVAVAGEAVVDDRGDDEGESHGDEEASDDGDGEGLEHLGAGTEGEGEWKHAADGSDGGHDDGTETTLGGVKHGLPGGVVVGIDGGDEAGGGEVGDAFGFGFVTEFLVGVEEEDAVFGDDADDHDEAHEAGDVEVGLGDEQGQNDAGNGEDGAGEDGDGSGEVAELGEEDAEDQGQGEDEDTGEIVEGFLLLLVGTAVFDADGGGQV